MSDWISVTIAGVALALSGYSLFIQQRRQTLTDRRANVTVTLHWLSMRANVSIDGKGVIAAGYHLVLANRGPATARDVNVKLSNSDGHALTLLDLGPQELPLVVLDADGRYPIPWVYEPFSRHERRFAATLTWRDDEGLHERLIPLRRGQLPH